MVGETAGVWGLVVYGPVVGKETARGRELRWWEEPRRHEAPGSLFFLRKKSRPDQLWANWIEGLKLWRVWLP